MNILFYTSVGILFYIYLGYPMLIWLFSLFYQKQVKRGDIKPDVTFLIAAFNEEKHIGKTLQNKLDLEYPCDKLEIIVISDGSTDSTESVVKEFSEKGVKLLLQERAGKTVALNRAVREAKGEILVFSDANSIYDRVALKNLVGSFSDPEIGYVTGRMIYVDPEGSSVGDGCTAYMKYENMLRSLETKIGSVVGVDGGIDAMRKSLFVPMGADQLPDFILPLRVVGKGFRVVYEPSAVLKEDSLEKAGDEYKMRLRVSLRAIRALFDMRHLLNIRRFPLFSWELFSHKVLRYFAFLFLITALLSNAFLFTSGFFFAAFFLLQCACYSAAALSYFLETAGIRARVLYLPYYFTLLNLASAHAFISFIAGRRQVIWTPRKGS